VTQQAYQPRTESALNARLNKRLRAYATAASAAGVGALALASSAEAKIVYTRVNKPLNYGLTLLDLNNDGTTDFAFCEEDSGSSNTTYCTLARHAKRASREKHAPSPFAQFLDVFAPAAKTKQNQIWGGQSLLGATAYAMPAGVSVGGQLKFTPGSRLMAACFEASSSNCFGPWQNAPHRYLGFKFVISGKVHYGWARLNVNWGLSGETATLTGYAYETIPNKPILTGDIVGPSKRTDNSRKAQEPDEARGVITNQAPSSLGLLARGAEGLVAWRKQDGRE
jgi:hypothetical protein